NAIEPGRVRDHVAALEVTARSAYYAQLVPEWLERLEDRGKLEIRAVADWIPLGHNHAMRDIAGGKAENRLGCGPGERRLRRNHRIQQGQGDSDTHSTEKHPAVKVLLGDE